MQTWKRLLLQIYRHGSMPARRWISNRLKAQRRSPVAVLYYHRVSDDRATDYTMPNDLFIEQMEWLRANFDMVSMEEAQRRLREGNDRPAVHVTFDDGYRSNCDRALPWLIRERIPCTYFVTWENARDGRPFDHDLKCGHSFEVNSLDELRAMAEAGIEIGAHTWTHADIGQLTALKDIAREIISARDMLAKAMRRPVRYFAFPFGKRANLSGAAIAMAAQCGIEAVCSAYGGFNLPGDDPFHIQRMPADNEILRLQNWLTGDPRKYLVRRYVYQRDLNLGDLPVHAPDETPLDAPQATFTQDQTTRIPPSIIEPHHVSSPSSVN